MDYHQNARLAKMALERGSTLKAAAAAFNVSPKTAAKWVRAIANEGWHTPYVIRKNWL